MLKATFLGTGPALPETGGDTASVLVNDTVLFDTGWNSTLRLTEWGHDPARITHLFFTHFHPDHYLGLPSLLFYRAMRMLNDTDKPLLTIVGISGEVEKVVARARQFLQEETDPAAICPLQVVPLGAGDSVTVGSLEISAGLASHTVPAFCYRVEDRETGSVLGFTGDSEYHPAIPEHLRHADLIIADATFGASPAPANNPYRHMGAPDAVRIAQEAHAKRLALTHARLEKRDAAVETARTLFPATFWPQNGETVTL
ncbi:MAG: MBL fold metallo-hydrolase [Armatimonadaceae bacterium]